MPEALAFAAVQEFAKKRAVLPRRSKGSVPLCMPAVMVLAYNARRRGIEDAELTDADNDHELPVVKPPVLPIRPAK